MVIFAFDATGSFSRDSKMMATELLAASQSIRSLRVPLTKSVKEVIIPSIRQNFNAEGRPSWAELKPATIKKRKYAHPILNDKGILRRRALQFNIWTIDKDSAQITGLDSRVDYAGYHQSGTSKMPQRAFVMYQPEDIQKINDIFYDFFYERLEGPFS